MVYTCANEVAEYFDTSVEQSEFLLADILRENRQPTFAERTWFQRELGWDSTKVNDQLRRMNNVLRLKAIAGSVADRKAAQKECETSAAVAEKEVPKLDEQIQKLQAKRDGIERDMRLAQKRTEQQSEAVSNLRKLIPEHIAGAVRVAMQAIESTIGREILDGEVRINELQGCLDSVRHRSESMYLESLKRSFRDAVSEIVEGRTLRRVLSPAWPSIRIAIEAELSALKEKLEGLRVEYKAAIQQAELPLDYYSNPPADG